MNNMNKMKLYIMGKYLLLFVLCCLTACHSNEVTNDDIDDKDIPVTPPGSSEENVNKPKGIWIDAHANFSRFATKDAITSYLVKIKDTGFNEIYLDVKPGIGYALYKSDVLKPLTKWGDETVNRDFDYLGFWLDEAERLGIDVIATISTMGYGDVNVKEGPIYDDNTWIGKTQVMLPENNDPTQLEDIRNQEGVDAAMLNPCLPEVQQFVISVVEEIVAKYPKLKGLCLDYCRWYGDKYGFGDATIKAFEANIGKSVTNKNDIITSEGGIGPLYKEWIEFRSRCITNLITNIRRSIKSINPNLEFRLWASADWGSRFGVGQNWASKKYIPDSSLRYTEKYNETGFADQLDVFVLGAYTEYVWIKDYPGSVWTVENFVNTYNDYVQDDCKVYGSIQSYAQYKGSGLSDAIYLCMKKTDGLMVFEISHVINNNSWAAIKEAIERVEK